MKEKDTKKLRTKLEKELEKLDGELKTVSRRNPDNKEDWEPVPEKIDALPSDSTEVADSIELFEENTAIAKQLEIRYNEVKRALEKIKTGKYGVCEIGGEQIEADRLLANPAAKTCKKHMKG